MDWRPLITQYHNPSLHWVGDGFETQSMLPYQRHAQDTSPFLLAGYNPPRHFGPTTKPRGVGMHPHRGFETVTVIYQGGLEHADTMGNRGTLGAGDVQWMTAGSGVQHEEFHSDLINRTGGTLEMVQLWVNLPQKDRMAKPRYQDVAGADIPQVALPSGGKIRVIAGEYQGVKGPIASFSPLAVWDGYLPQGAAFDSDLPAGWSQSVLLLSGSVRVNESLTISGPQSLIFSTDPGRIRLEASEEAHFLMLSGQALNEPLVMSGPFVAGSEAELQKAYQDFRQGQF